MLQSPKSLTATVHVKFHYTEQETKPCPGQVEIIAKILDQASELDPDMQELLVKFANYLNQFSPKPEERG